MVLKVHTTPADTTAPKKKAGMLPWWLCWETYLILLVAGSLRFYKINTTEFDQDQAMLFRLAHDAVAHGLLPVTSNAASIGISNPPGVIYLFMPVALLTANPMWGAVLVGLFTTIAALLTYLFTRHYYGRMAGTIAALLYATAAEPLNYARFIWQPNLMPPFVVLFIFTLFIGVVERRKGWLLPALVLFGILYQMHPTTVLLAFPFILALLLSPGTLRWRDLFIAIVILLVLFFPYLLWEYVTKFADLRTLFTLSKQHAKLDSQVFSFYQLFLSPFGTPPTYPTSVVRRLVPYLSWLKTVLPMLVIGGLLTTLLLLIKPPANRWQRSVEPTHLPWPRWLRALWADPYRCGLLVLLIWQIGPVLVLLRHSVDLHAQYFFLLMPGPFIFIGLFFSSLVRWIGHLLRNLPSLAAILQAEFTAFAVILILTQFVGSAAAVYDTSHGNFSDRAFQPYPYHNDLQSLTGALHQADQLAQQQHLNHVYITSDAATETALNYLVAQMHTPTTLFSANCLVLPNPDAGPAVMLVGPYDDLTNALLSHFAEATLVGHLPRLGGPPFSLYIVRTPARSQTNPQESFPQYAQLLNGTLIPFTFQHQSHLTALWSILRSAAPALRTSYNYQIRATLPDKQTHIAQCGLTSLRQGDQLVTAFGMPSGAAQPTEVTLQMVYFVQTPMNPTYGPFHLETDSEQSTPWYPRPSATGKLSITVP
jgi:hypothetical protein